MAAAARSTSACAAAEGRQTAPGHQTVAAPRRSHRYPATGARSAAHASPKSNAGASRGRDGAARAGARLGRRPLQPRHPAPGQPALPVPGALRRPAGGPHRDGPRPPGEVPHRRPRFGRDADHASRHERPVRRGPARRQQPLAGGFLPRGGTGHAQARPRRDGDEHRCHDHLQRRPPLRLHGSRSERRPRRPAATSPGWGSSPSTG